MEKKYVHSYKLISSHCKNKWENTKGILLIYDKLIDERSSLKRRIISCGCCMPSKEIVLELEDKKEAI